MHSLRTPGPLPAADAPGRDAVRTAVNRLVRDRTGSMLSDLRVRIDAEHAVTGGEYAVELTGRCGSFYGKQLAGVAAMAAAPRGVVQNRIAVG